MKITNLGYHTVVNYTRKEAIELARRLLEQVELHVQLNDEIETGGVPLSPPPAVVNGMMFNMLPCPDGKSLGE